MGRHKNTILLSLEWEKLDSDLRRFDEVFAVVNINPNVRRRDAV